MIQQQSTQSRLDYLRKARNYAKRQFDKLIISPEYRYAHPSHAVAHALQLTEARYPDLGTFGVEGTTSDYGQDVFTIQYLHTGETYDLTICYYKSRFIVSSWGDIAERYL
jgi:hypothetical protein